MKKINCINTFQDMERRLSECGYYISKDSIDKPDVTVEIEIACKNCPFATWQKAFANNLANARSKAILAAGIDRREFCPVLNPHSNLKFKPGEKIVPECFTPQYDIEQTPQRGWIKLS